MNKLHVEIEGDLHIRTARRIEEVLRNRTGVSDVSISASGILFIKWNSDQIARSEIIEAIKKLGLKIVNIGSPDRQSPRRHRDRSRSILNLFGEKTELYYAIVSGVCWVLGVILTFTAIPGTIATGLFVIGAVFGGVFTFSTAGKDLLSGEFQIDFLMLFAAVGAAILGHWGESALLLFLFSLGQALEQYAMRRARKSISALSDLTPPMALLKHKDGLKEVHIEELKAGDLIVVKPNSTIAADGVVATGTSNVDQAAITGESMPVSKRPHTNWQGDIDIEKLLPEHRVFAGTINGAGALEIKVLKEAKDSTLSRLIYLVKEAETQKSPTQLLTDKFEKYYVPSVLVVVVLLFFPFLFIDETFQQSFYRAMSVLIAASPCALAISTPSAVLAGIGRAARKGVLIKGGRPLEDLGGIRSIAFDKTGTLTEGRPTLTHAIPYGTTTKTHLLKVAVAVEALSDHPLAAAIVKGGRAELGDIEIAAAQNLTALTARGIRADWDGSAVHIGNRRLCEELTGAPIPEDMDRNMSELESEGHTAMIVHQDDDYLGIISAMDIARPEAASTLAHLKKMGIKRIVMLTGDNQLVANAIAGHIGITDPMGSLLPEHKVDAIEQLKHHGSVAMVGDGVNDAPAMAQSTVGIAMGAVGSDVALETADIALMADKLDKLPFAIGLSRRANRIIRQNLIISLGMVALLVPLTIMGTIAIGPAVVGHEGSTVLVVFNALRLLRYEK